MKLRNRTRTDEASTSTMQVNFYRVLIDDMGRQIQQRRIAELSSTDNRRFCIHEGHPALSADCIEFLVKQSDVTTRMDALCRCVLVICGIEKHSAAEAGILLALDRTTVEGAYCAALQLLEVISCEQLLQQNDFLAVCN